jgi:hypothetical protein
MDCQSYWPIITCPTLFLEAANDFNAPFDLVTQAMALQATNVPQVLAFTAHRNHQFDTAAYASRVLWQKAYLTDGFNFPPRSEAHLELTQPDGIPIFKVWPDDSTTNTIVDVDIYYGLERNSLIRFWRDAQAVETNGHWEAPCPIYDLDEMVAALAVVTYDTGFDFDMPAGYTSPTRFFSVASEVSTIYPPDLANNGVQETEVKERVIDDFARGYHDWYQFADRSWTRKLRDPSWRGPSGGELAFEVVTTTAGNWLGIQLITEFWNSTDANTYSAFAHLPSPGTSSVSLSLSAFTNGQGAALTTWEEVNQLGLMPGRVLNGSLPAWTGATAVYSNLHWASGNYLPEEEFARWMAGFGPRGTNAATDADVEGDGFYNLFEYGVGSSPISGAHSGLPTIGNTHGAGFQGLEYVYRRRIDAAARGLTYYVQSDTNLMASTWSTNNTEETGAGVIDGEFESVTNRIAGGDLTLGRLKIIMED